MGRKFTKNASKTDFEVHVSTESWKE